MFTNTRCLSSKQAQDNNRGWSGAYQFSMNLPVLAQYSHTSYTESLFTICEHSLVNLFTETLVNVDHTTLHRWTDFHTQKTGRTCTINVEIQSR